MSDNHDLKIQPPIFYLNPKTDKDPEKKLLKEFHRQNALLNVIKDYDAKFGKPEPLEPNEKL